MGEDGVCDRRAEIAALVAVTRLEDHRLPLRRALDVERAGHLEEFAAMVEAVEPVGVEELARRPVADQRALLPTGPEAARHV